MFDSALLDVAIGLVFIYFFLSLLCSVMIESFTALFKKRPRMLKNAIKILLDNDNNLLDKLYNQPLFLGKTPKGFLGSLYEALLPFPSKKVRTPSYISSRSFVLALLESIKEHPNVATQFPGNKFPSLDSVANIKQLVEALPDQTKIKKALIPLLESAGDKSAGDNLEKALANMEKWYDESMQRVTGWYKRYSQALALFLAILLSLGLNADTFEIGKSVYLNKSLRDSLVKMAEEVRQTPPPLPSANETKEKNGKKPDKQSPPPSNTKPQKGQQNVSKDSPVTKPVGQQGKAVSPPSDPKAETEKGQQKEANQIAPGEPQKSKQDKEDDLDKRIKAANAYYKQLRAINLPMGWPTDKTGSLDWEKILGNDKEAGILNTWKVLGILFTAFLVSLGSNFWFELLNKLVNMRSAGKKPPTKEEQEAQGKGA